MERFQDLEQHGVPNALQVISVLTSTNVLFKNVVQDRIPLAVSESVLYVVPGTSVLMPTVLSTHLARPARIPCKDLQFAQSVLLATHARSRLSSNRLQMLLLNVHLGRIHLANKLAALVVQGAMLVQARRRILVVLASWVLIPSVPKMYALCVPLALNALKRSRIP
jgi:hypothetical protein